MRNTGKEPDNPPWRLPHPSRVFCGRVGYLTPPTWDEARHGVKVPTLSQSARQEWGNPEGGSAHVDA